MKRCQLEHILRAAAGTPYTAISTNVGATAWTDTNRVSGSLYHYSVAALDGCHESVYSSYAFAGTNVTLYVQLSGASVILNWPLGTLESASQANGPYGSVAGAVSPCTNPVSGAQQFYRVLVQ